MSCFRESTRLDRISLHCLSLLYDYHPKSQSRTVIQRIGRNSSTNQSRNFPKFPRSIYFFLLFFPSWLLDRFSFTILSCQEKNMPHVSRKSKRRKIRPSVRCRDNENTEWIAQVGSPVLKPFSRISFGCVCEPTRYSPYTVRSCILYSVWQHICNFSDFPYKMVNFRGLDLC